MADSLAVVILNYNGAGFLGRFLPQVVEYSRPHRVVVADNASTDDSRRVVERIAGAEWLPLSQNYGYAEGYNQALRQLNYTYYILLNSDVRVSPNWVTPLLRRLKSSNRIVACQPKILNEAQPDEFEYAGAAGGYLDWLGVPFCRGRIFSTLEKDTGQYNNAVEVHWASGACLAIKAGAFHRAGGFDGSFFAHMEEIDLCWRLRRAGFQIWYEPESTVYHVGGGTLPADSPRKTYLNYRNGWYMLLKNKTRLWPWLPIRLLQDYAAAILWLSKGQISFASAILKAHLEVAKNFARVRPSAQVYNTTEFSLYPNSIVAQYYVRKAKTFGQLKNKPD